MSERLDRFVDLMKGIFELDKSDLDFGIYRIMNIRKAEIENFLTNQLPEKVRGSLESFAPDTTEMEERIREIEAQCSAVGVDVSESKMAKEYAELKSQLAAGIDFAALETDVYSALYSFFNRYYDEGDFISKRRYKEGVYAIPYEGEEVKLYWANQDQYYIKTAENFKDYTFVARNAYGDACTVHFLLVDATTEQNNNKESDDSKRTFMLYQEDEERPELKTFEYRADTNELIVRFVFDVPEDKKAKYLELNSAAIRAKIATDYPQLVNVLLTDVSTDKKKPKTLIDKHLEAYVAKNTFDYFIHKDLKGFLDRELDFYIKSEVIHLDDLDTPNEKRVEAYLAKVRAIKRVGHILIDFLAQIEDFQKKLWLKKKFVVETNWCMTLDKIDEAFWPEIIANAAQMQEWIDMYAIDEVEGNLATIGWTNPPTLDFLRQNQNLVVDTKHFTTDFKDRLVASIDDLDEQTGGVIIKSENYQALKLLASQKKLSQIIYIDPPYNTGSDDNFCYKDGYRSSTWLSMIKDRIEAGWQKLSDDGVMFISIGEEEYNHLSVLLRELYGDNRFFATLVWEKKKKGSFLSGKIACMKDYVLCVAKDAIQFEGLIGEITSEETTYPCVNASNVRDVRTIKLPLDSKYREANYTLPKGSTISAGNMSLKLLSDLVIKDRKLVPPLTIEGNWRYSQASMDEYAEDGKLYITQDLYLRRIVCEPRYKRMRDLLLRLGDDTNDADFRAIDLNNLNKFGWGSNEDANDELLHIHGKQYAASYPKPIKLIMKLLVSTRKEHASIIDYFAGSGSTGQAILNLNRLDNSGRKYCLIDMGEYFSSVALPRMKKAVYSSDWELGKPTSRTVGISHILKYFTLESYEDALSNIELSEENHGMFSLLGDDYLIHYMLDIESRGSLLKLEQFKMPFNYQMKINERNETKNRPVDLVETFNYLIGLSVSRQSTVSYFRSEPDASGGYEGAVRLIRDADGEFAFKQVEGTLPDGRRTLVIWRTISDDLLACNAALDAYFNKHRINPQDREFAVIYVNGDNNLENLRTGEESWKVKMIEPEFKSRMFEEE